MKQPYYFQTFLYLDSSSSSSPLIIIMNSNNLLSVASSHSDFEISSSHAKSDIFHHFMSFDHHNHSFTTKSSAIRNQNHDAEKVLKLIPNHSIFDEIENVGVYKRYEFQIDNCKPTDVLIVSIKDLFSERISLDQSFNTSLYAFIERKDNISPVVGNSGIFNDNDMDLSSIKFNCKSNRDELNFLLTPAHGLQAGSYILSISRSSSLPSVNNPYISTTTFTQNDINPTSDPYFSPSRVATGNKFTSLSPYWRPQDQQQHQRIKASSEFKIPGKGPLVDKSGKSRVSFTTSGDLNTEFLQYSSTLPDTSTDPISQSYSQQIDSVSSIPVRIQYKLLPKLESAVVLHNNKPVSGVVNRGTYNYYNFYLPPASDQIIAFILSYPRLNVRDNLEIYVSNRYDGLLPVTSSDHIWCHISPRTSNAHTGVVEQAVYIHPTDPHSRLGSVFTVSVYCRPDETFSSSSPGISYTLKTILLDPAKEPISTLSWGRNNTDLSLTSGTFARYEINLTAHIANKQKLKISIRPKVSPIQLKSDTKSNAVATNTPSVVEVCNGLSVTTSLFTSASYPILRQTFDKELPSHLSSFSPSTVVYLSRTCMLPGPSNYEFKAGGDDGNIDIFVSPWEFGLASSDESETLVLYMSVFQEYPHNQSSAGIETEEVHQSPPTLLSLTTEVLPHMENLSNEQKIRHDIFKKIFCDINGSMLSLRDRKKLAIEHDTNFIYSEIQFTTLIDILYAANVPDGCSFYDLGCGAGHALVAALFSSIKFSQIIGIEYLPKLCRNGNLALHRVKLLLQGATQLPLKSSSSNSSVTGYLTKMNLDSSLVSESCDTSNMSDDSAMQAFLHMTSSSNSITYSRPTSPQKPIRSNSVINFNVEEVTALKELNVALPFTEIR